MDGFFFGLNAQQFPHTQLHLVLEDGEVERTWEGYVLLYLWGRRMAAGTIFLLLVSMLLQSRLKDTQPGRLWTLQCIWKVQTPRMKHELLPRLCQIENDESINIYIQATRKWWINDSWNRIVHWLINEIFDLLESSTSRNEKQQNPLPELATRETINCHIGKVSPENRGRNLPDQRHGTNSKSHKYGLQQVADSLLIYSHWQICINIFLRIKLAICSCPIFMFQHSILQVLQFFVHGILQ